MERQLYSEGVTVDGSGMPGIDFFCYQVIEV
jgi:hypothetical protein